MSPFYDKKEGFLFDSRDWLSISRLSPRAPRFYILYGDRVGTQFSILFFFSFCDEKLFSLINELITQHFQKGKVIVF